MPGKSSPRRPLPPPADVLAGRVLVDADTLIQLIRDCNPTGRELPEEERRRRYLRKARLQSLLLRRFPGDVRAVRERGQHAVLILHRGRSAGHAPLEALDEDVRALLQRRLDEEGVASHAPPAPTPRPGAASAHAPTPRPPVPAPRQELRGPAARGAQPRPAPRAARRRSIDERQPAPIDPLRGGEAALHAFDYERALALFRRALEEATPERRAPAARALLGLLVETLADDEAALELDGALPDEAQADAEVRALLGEAAARTGRCARAAELVAGQTGRRAVIIQLLLFDAAIERGDLPAAEAALERAAALDPAEPGVADRGERLRSVRAAERLPLEAELRRLLDAHADGEAEGVARQLLGRWPKNAAARAALSAIAGRRHRAEAEVLRRAAEEAIAQGRPGAAIGPLSEALRLTTEGPLRDRLRALLTEADHAQQRERLAARLAAAVQQLGAADAGPGLVAYLALPPAARESARAQAPAEARHLLDWVDEMHGARPDAPARTLADAARALGDAEGQDPEVALAHLRGHERALGPLPRYQRIVAAAHERQRARRQEEARARLAAVRAAQAAGTPEETVRAQALLAGTELHLLDEAEQQEADELLLCLEAQRERHDQEVRFRHLRASTDATDLLRAQEIAAHLSESKPAPERAEWRAQAEELAARVRRAFCVRYSDVTSGRQPEMDGALTGRPDWTSSRWLVTGQDLLIYQVSRGARLFMIYVGFDGQVRGRARLRAPANLNHLVDEVHGDALWIAGWSGALLELSLPELSVRRYVPPGELVHDGEVAWEAHLSSGARFLWLGVVRAGRVSYDYRVVDLGRPRSAGRVGELRALRAVCGGDGGPDVVVGAADSDAVLLFEPDGRPLRRVALPRRAALRDAAPHPCHGGLLVLLGLEQADAPGEARRLACLEISAAGAAGPLRVLEGTRDGECQLMSDRAARMAYVSAEVDGPGGEGGGAGLLLGLRPEDGALGERYRVAAPEGRALVRDGAAERVTLAYMSAAGVRLEVLGEEPPALRDAAPRRNLALEDVASCWLPASVDDAPMQKLYRTFLRMQPAQRLAGLQAAILSGGRDIRTIIGVECMLSRRGHGEEALSLCRDALRTRRDLGLRLALAQHEARAGRFAEVRAILSEEEVGPIWPTCRTRHFYHLLGLSLLHTGAVEAGLAVLRAGVEHHGTCPLEDLAAIAEALGEGALPDDAEASPAQRLVRAIRRADQRAAADDLDGVIAELDVPLVWQEDELQSTARLCAAHLSRPPAPADEAGRFRVALLLANFLAFLQGDPRRDLPLPEPGARWGRARLLELGRLAEAWLEADEAL